MRREEVGNGADVGSWGQPHGFRGRGAAAGRCLRVLTADAKGRPDHVGDRHQHGHLFLGWPHVDGYVHRHDGHDGDHPHEHHGADRVDPPVPRGVVW